MSARGLCDQDMLLDHWYVVAEGADVDPGPHAVRVLSRDFVLWRGPDGALVASEDRCPHREAALSLGCVEDGELACAYHGWAFGAGGVCVRVPSSAPTVPVPPKAHLPTVTVEERYGLVWLCPGTPASSIPLMSVDDDPAYRRINSGVDIWEVGATRMVDNFLDISHFPYVHLGTFGIQENTEVPKIELAALDDGWYGYEYEVEVTNELGATASGIEGAIVERRMTTGFHLPFSVRSTIHYHTGLEHHLLLISTPIDERRSYFSFVVWRNDDFSVPGEEVITFDRAIGAEDKVMLERIPGLLSLGQTETVSVQSDKASVEWRRRLVELIGS